MDTPVSLVQQFGWVSKKGGLRSSTILEVNGSAVSDFSVTDIPPLAEVRIAQSVKSV